MDWPPKFQQLIKVKVWGHLSLIGAFEIFLQTKYINPDQKALDEYLFMHLRLLRKHFLFMSKETDYKFFLNYNFEHL